MVLLGAKLTVASTTETLLLTYPSWKESAETQSIKSCEIFAVVPMPATLFPVVSVPLTEVLTRMELWLGRTLTLAQSKFARVLVFAPAAGGVAVAETARPKSSVMLEAGTATFTESMSPTAKTVLNEETGAKNRACSGSLTEPTKLA